MRVHNDEDSLLEKFENAWQSGSPPDIEKALAPLFDVSDSTRIAFIELDLEYRWKRFGDLVRPKPPESALAEFPSVANYLLALNLNASLEQLVDLVSLEFRLRQRFGDAISVTDLTQANADVLDNEAIAQLRTILEGTRPAESSLNTDLKRSDQIGSYKILQKIAEGGMGAVYLAEQQKPIRREVALKVIKSGGESEDIIARFEAERQALALMDHPNIARILDGGSTIDGRPYFVMELVDGIPLAEYCDTHQLSIADRLNLFVPVCQAVQHAHKKGIIHRDLKPSNVLVTTIDGKAVPKVIDFGLAKAIEHTVRLTDKTMFTEFGQVIGTFKYMSPEQAEMSDDIDSQTDVYSLGVMLYELLTGSTPLTGKMLGKNLIKALDKIQDSELQKPSLRLSTAEQSAVSISSQRQITASKLKNILQGELDWVVMKSLERDRKRRYETPDSFAQDVRRFLNNEPVVARPPSTAYRLRKFARKHFAAVAATVLTMVALLAATVVSTVFYFEADSQRNRAEFQQGRAEDEKKIAIRETERATRESKAHERVSEKLTEVINSGDPIFGALLSRYGSVDAPATVRGIVEKLTQEELSDTSDLIDVPLVRAKHLDTLGDKNMSFGDVRTAQRLFGKSSELFEASGVTTGLDFAKNLMALGTCDYLMGDIASAKSRLRRSLALRDPEMKILPNGRVEIRDLAFARFVLGGLHMDLEEFDEARKFLDLVIGMDPEAAPEMPLQIAMAHLMKAATRAYQGEVEDGSAWASPEVLVSVAAVFLNAPGNQRLLEPFQWAFAAEASYHAFGSARLPAYTKMHTFLVEATGEQHFLTVISRWGMAISADRDDNFEKAIEYLEDLSNFVDRHLSRQHPRFAMVLDRHADVLFDHWRDAKEKDITDLQRAKKLGMEAIELRLSKLGEHRLTAISLARLGRIELGLGDFKEARNHLLQSISIREAVYGRTSSIVSTTYRYLIDALIADKDYEAAEKHCRELVTIGRDLLEAKKLKQAVYGHYQLYLVRVLMFEKTKQAKIEIKKLLEQSKVNLQAGLPQTKAVLTEVKWRQEALEK